MKECGSFSLVIKSVYKVAIFLRLLWHWTQLIHFIIYHLTKYMRIKPDPVIQYFLKFTYSCIFIDNICNKSMWLLLPIEFNSQQAITVLISKSSASAACFKRHILIQGSSCLV